MTSVNGNSDPPHLAYLLHLATRRMRAEAEHDVAEPFRSLSAAQARLLDSVPDGGVRVTALSSSMLVSKQGLGQLVNQLVNGGFVTVEPDPADGRARVIRCTGRGQEAQRMMRQRLADVEESWRDQVGAERYGVFREVLADLVAGFVT